MQLWHRPILASVALLAAATASAQVALDRTVFTTVNSTTAWTNNDGTELGAGTSPTATTVNHNVAFGTPSVTYSTQLVGSSSGNADATILLSNLSPNLLQFTDSTWYTNRVWVSFSAVASVSSVWNNLKLLDGQNTNQGIVVGVGSVGSTPGTANWGIGYGPESGGTTSSSAPFGPTAALGATQAMTNRSFILMQIDYNTGTNADVFSIWRSATPFSLDAHGAPASFSTLGAAAATRTNDFNFDRISIYAGTGSQLYLTDITITAEIPEPSTYAFALGTGVLALVGYPEFVSCEGAGRFLQREAV